jgi:hypothetical protein
MRKLSAISFWVGLGCAVVNAYLFFISLSVPAFHHLQTYHLTMLVVCAIAVVLNYFSLGDKNG